MLASEHLQSDTSTRGHQEHVVAPSPTPPRPCSSAVQTQCQPPNSVSKPPKNILLGSLAQPMTDASPPTASQLTATSRIPLTDIRSSTGIPLPTKPNPQSASEGNRGFCEIPQCLSASKLKPPSFLWRALLGTLISCFVPLF